MKLRRLCAVLLAIACAFAVAGCGDTKPDTEKPVEEFSMFFDHGFNKQKQNELTNTGKTSYTMYAGKNEIENCQFILAANTTDKNGLTAAVSKFVKGSDEIDSIMYKAEYFLVDGKPTPDAMLPYKGESFDIAKGNSQIFFVEAEIPQGAAAGDYTATVEVKDGEEVLKSGVVTLHVWDFELSEETSNTVIMELEEGRLTATAKKGGLYGTYYDFLLRNRVSAYGLPYDFESQKAEKYLDNPRVRGFRVRTASDAVKVKRLGDRNPAWAEKAIFYTVDEPRNEDAWNKIVTDGNHIKSQLGDNYRFVSPFFTPGYIGSIDCLELMRKAINVWCPKTALYTSEEEAENIDCWEDIKFYSIDPDETFESRMQSYKEQGDELWWYTCWDPTAPYITLNIEEKGVNPRIMFWQQKYFDITGYLYFMVNEWGSSTEGAGSWAEDSWDAHYKVNSMGENTWGDGQLLYCGERRGYDGPVGSMRLNAVRDGIEDFEYMTMLEKKIGFDKVKELISAVTTGVATYTSDTELFANQRILLGNTLEAELKK